MADVPQPETGILYALGLGPGDPGLVTMGAAEVLRRVDAVAFPLDPDGQPGRAYQTAASYISPEVTRVPLSLPMTGDRGALQDAWKQAVDTMWAHAEEGNDVAYLCLGDALLYGSFGYLLDRYPGKVEIVSGVISPVAAAASLRLPLAEGREPLTLVPDAGDSEVLRGALGLQGTVVIMKASRLGEEGVRVLEETGALERAWIARDVTLTNEVLERADAESLLGLPYFSLVVVPAARPRPEERADIAEEQE